MKQIEMHIWIILDRILEKCTQIRSCMEKLFTKDHCNCTNINVTDAQSKFGSFNFKTFMNYKQVACILPDFIQKHWAFQDFFFLFFESPSTIDIDDHELSAILSKSGIKMCHPATIRVSKGDDGG